MGSRIRSISANSFPFAKRGSSFVWRAAHSALLEGPRRCQVRPCPAQSQRQEHPAPWRYATAAGFVGRVLDVRNGGGRRSSRRLGVAVIAYTATASGRAPTAAAAISTETAIPIAGPLIRNRLIANSIVCSPLGCYGNREYSAEASGEGREMRDSSRSVGSLLRVVLALLIVSATALLASALPHCRRRCSRPS